MNHTDEKMLLEILRMARELVINEYTDRRAQDHNTWVFQSQNLWATQRTVLKYPDIPPYPTERDIIERAQMLLKFLVIDKPSISNIEKIKLPVTEINETPEAETPEVVTETQKETVSQEPQQEKEDATPSAPSGILPSVLKKIEQMRKLI